MNFAHEVNSLLSRFGVVIMRKQQLDNTQRLIRKAVEENFEIRVVYDIGAFKGEYTSALQRILPNALYYLFEGNYDHEAELRKLSHRYFIEILSESDQDKEWWSISGTGDSLFKENQEVYNSINPVVRSTRSLDSLINEHNLDLPDLIKLDVQGAELSVLRGGSKAVANASLICLEIPIPEFNKGAPRISEYLDYMKMQNFIPIELLEVHKASDVIIQIDIAFARKDKWAESHDLSGRTFLS